MLGIDCGGGQGGGSPGEQGAGGVREGYGRWERKGREAGSL